MARQEDLSLWGIEDHAGACYFPTATCGYKARLTLAEKVDFTHRVLDATLALSPRLNI